VHNPVSAPATRPACESWRKLARLSARLSPGLVLWLVLCGGVRPVTAQPARTADGHASPAGAAQPSHEAPVSEHAVSEGHTGEEQHGESPWAFAGKLFNFAVLVGLLVYFLRDPLRRYLADRGTQIRTDLVTAAVMKEDAARQITAIDTKLKQLPAELDGLRERGQREIAAEQARIEQAAAAERERLLEQTRREIDLQLRAARRDLVTHAADLAVQVARERIRARITTEDQRRLLDRYLEQVSTHE
jgi:F-type H+-transporting ATPase subunit b